MIDTKMPMQVVLQVLPHMGAGGLVRGAIDAAAAQVGAGWVALVASEGGNGVRELERLGAPVQRGVFGADMQVASVNDGPITMVLDSPR